MIAKESTGVEVEELYNGYIIVKLYKELRINCCNIPSRVLLAITRIGY